MGTHVLEESIEESIKKQAYTHKHTHTHTLEAHAHTRTRGCAHTRKHKCTYAHIQTWAHRKTGTNTEHSFATNGLERSAWGLTCGRATRDQSNGCAWGLTHGWAICDQCMEALEKKEHNA